MIECDFTWDRDKLLFKIDNYFRKKTQHQTHEFINTVYRVRKFFVTHMLPQKVYVQNM
jgi:hypothetical protein